MQMRLKLKKVQNGKEEIWFAQTKKFIFWDDIEIRGMKLYSRSSDRLMKVMENSMNVEVFI